MLELGKWWSDDDEKCLGFGYFKRELIRFFVELDVRWREEFRIWGLKNRIWWWKVGVGIIREEEVVGGGEFGGRR